MCGPTVAVWGSDEQKQRYLRPLFTGEEIWCQLFSEPGSGSDFAGLSSRGVRDGDEWIVNGQKVWTTLAHLARWGLLVVRTDPEAVKHAGLTAFVVDMQDPTVDTRPLRQMTGEAEFNEVYFTDTRVPDSERLGEVGDGWRVSLTTLMNERVSIGGSIPQRGSGVIAPLVKAFKDLPGGAPRGRARRGHEAVGPRRGAAAHQHPRQPEPQDGRSGPRGLDRQDGVGRPEQGRLGQDDRRDGRRRDALRQLRDEAARTSPWASRRNQKAFLRSRANSIEGGTTEVMKNILGERVLGLPGDVRVDRDVAWSKVPRN